MLISDWRSDVCSSDLGGVTCIKPPGYASCKASMSLTAGQVYSQTLDDGGTWTIGRDDNTTIKDPDSPAPSDGHNQILVTDPAAKENWLTIPKTQPYTTQAPARHTTTFPFTDGVHTHDPRT